MDLISISPQVSSALAPLDDAWANLPVGEGAARATAELLGELAPPALLGPVSRLKAALCAYARWATLQLSDRA